MICPRPRAPYLRRMSLAHADRVVPRPKRVYTAVSVEPEGEGFAVKLDGRSAKTPAGAALVAPARALAELLAGEWEAQAVEIDWALMPATRLAFTTLDHAAETRVALAAELARYAAGDTLTYLADDTPRLHARQVAQQLPLLDWAATELGVRLETVAGVMHRPQPEASIARARALAAAEDDFALAGLAFAAALFGSAVLAFAVRRGRLTGEQAHDLARLEEAHQESEWGVDSEAAERTASRLEEARFVERWFRALA